MMDGLDRHHKKGNLPKEKDYDQKTYQKKISTEKPTRTTFQPKQKFDQNLQKNVFDQKNVDLKNTNKISEFFFLFSDFSDEKIGRYVFLSKTNFGHKKVD